MMPPEVADYFKEGVKKPISARTERPYTLFVLYDDGVEKSQDMTNQLFGVFEILKDYALFSRPIVDDGRCIKWIVGNEVLDIDKDAFYIYGK